MIDGIDGRAREIVEPGLRELFDELLLLDAFQNTLYVAAIATPIATLIGTLCAFGLVRIDLPFKPLLGSLILMPMVVPGILLGAALLVVLVPILGLHLSLWTALRHDPPPASAPVARARRCMASGPPS
jgi:ABC-type spermidine/putrescine transport system permease subunit II